jgi:hypothetical protein
LVQADGEDKVRSENGKVGGREDTRAFGQAEPSEALAQEHGSNGSCRDEAE